MNNAEKDIEQLLSDAITERAYPFECKGRTFFLYPTTIGKMHLTQRLYAVLAISDERLAQNPALELLRAVKEHKDIATTIVAYHTCYGKEVLEYGKVTKRAKFFSENVNDSDVAAILLTILTSDKTDAFIKHLGIDREQQRMQKVSDVKARNNKNSVHVGGKSIYGALIAPLLEMGLSWDEIVWERSYVNLRLLLADKCSDMYLTDEEVKHLPAWVRGGGQYIKADDPKNKELIKSMSWK